MTKNIIIIILTALALSWLLYWICTSSDVEYAKELQALDERIMELQYKIDQEQLNYKSCQELMNNAHNAADEYRKEIENLNNEKARLVGLEME